MKVVRISAIWCPSCLLMKEIWKSVESTYNNFEYIDYDYDMDYDKIEEYDVGNILPVFILLDDNDKEIKRIIGEHTKQEMLEFMR